MSHAILPQAPLPAPAARRSTALLASLSCFALLSACGGAEEVLSAYLSPFAPPAPVGGAVLSAFLPGWDDPALAGLTNTLLGSFAYSNSSASLAWLQTLFDSNVTGQVYALRSSGAAFAHAAGIRGADVVIAVSDSHLSAGHAVFAGTNVTIDSNGPAGSEHGTSVASVALGQSASFTGTAPDADLLFGYFGEEGAYSDLTSLGQRALDMGAVAWNNSWGYRGLYVNQTDFGVAFAGTDGQAYLAAIDAYAAEGVVVFAMSNDPESNAGIMDGLPFLRPTLEAGWLAAVNGVPTFTGGVVSSVYLLSSSCLQAARWCLIADGSWNAATGAGTSYGFTTGSSFAAPQISGALALLAEAFPLLSRHDLRVRLLASAEDDFFAADDTVELADGFFKGYSITYGHGFLDIEAALKPIGPTAMSLAEGRQVLTDSPVLMTGTGMGDAIEVSLAGTDVLVRDALSAGFVMPGGALTAGARPASQAAAILSRSLAANLAQERTAAVSALADPFAAFGGRTLNLTDREGLSAASVLMPQVGAESAGVQVSRVLSDGSMRVELGLKVARDDGQKMSLDGSDGALMASVSLGLTQDLGGDAFLALSGEIGVTDLGGATAFGDAGSARFDSLALTAGRSDVFSKGDRISIGVAMPIAIASGETVVDLPVYRQGAAAGFEPVVLNLAPENRQVDLEVSYQTALADGLEMKFSVAHSDNFGNRAGETDTGGAIALTFRF